MAFDFYAFLKHGPRPQVVGNNNDISALAPSGQISQTIGHFENVINVTSESGPIGNSGPSITNAYTLQINTNFFGGTAVCTASPNPGCQGWEQFVYENDGSNGHAYIQYWIIAYNATCPTGQGWNQIALYGGTYCWKNNSLGSVSVPNQPITNMANWTFSGQVSATGDRVTMSTGTMAYARDGDNAVDAANGWTTAEFNIFGDGGNSSGGGTATFNAGASTNARTQIFYGDRTAPTCVAQGFTAEMNNLSFGPTAPAATARPNIMVIWGDDIGMWNVGAYTHGMMGHTPNIDSIAREGMLFTDHYGQPSCTAGRAAFILGQYPVRTGMTTIGIPGSKRGVQKSDPTLAEVLKSAGYTTAQFGKNHLGDRNEFLPTVHGFDEWFGNLYHLNAEEEPEELDYPGQKNPEYKEMFGPRGVLHCWATDKDDPTTDPKFGRVGKQKIKDTGPLTRKRMEKIDGEVLDVTLDWLDRKGNGKEPFFCWFNTTATHVWSHSPSKYIQKAVDEGRAEEDVYRAKMIEHDEQVGKLLKKLKQLGVDDNTIVIYSTDNGNELMMWPDGGYAPFRGEKGTTWEGGVRVPCLVKWPGKIAPRSVSNGIQNHEDLYSTLAAAAGLPDIKDKLLKGHTMNGTKYKVHLDGYNNLDHWTGDSEKSARREIFYYDETDLMALRVDAWKMHIGVKRDNSWWDAKYYPSVPYLFNLLMDPMEKMDPQSHEWGYAGRKFFAQKMWAPTASARFIKAHLESMLAFPPSQGADTLGLHKALEEAQQKMLNPGASSN